MSQVHHSETNSMATREELGKLAQQLQLPDKLLEACAAAQEQMPVPRVVANCGSASLRIIQAGVGRGNIFVDLHSFLGPILSAQFVGIWVKLAFPPAGGVFNNSNTRVIGLGTTHVVLGASITPGAGKIFANLTDLEVTTAEGHCIGLFPSDTVVFV